MKHVVAGVNIIGTEQGIFTQVVVEQSSTVRVEVWYNFVVIERRIGKRQKTNNSDSYLTNRSYKALKIAHASLSNRVASGFTSPDVIGSEVQLISLSLAGTIVINGP